jgi:hypothetical protein
MAQPAFLAFFALSMKIQWDHLFWRIHLNGAHDKFFAWSEPLTSVAATTRHASNHGLAPQHWLGTPTEHTARRLGYASRILQFVLRGGWFLLVGFALGSLPVMALAATALESDAAICQDVPARQRLACIRNQRPAEIRSCAGLLRRDWVNCTLNNAAALVCSDQRGWKADACIEAQFSQRLLYESFNPLDCHNAAPDTSLARRCAAREQVLAGCAELPERDREPCIAAPPSVYHAPRDCLQNAERYCTAYDQALGTCMVHFDAPERFMVCVDKEVPLGLKAAAQAANRARLAAAGMDALRRLGPVR